MKIRRKYLTKDQREEICKKCNHKCKVCPLAAKGFMYLSCVDIRKAQRQIDDYWEEEIEI